MSSCILVADIVGGPRRGNAAAATEIRHALERCHNRVKLAIETHGGVPARDLSLDPHGAFRSVDDAVLAACEMIDRIHKLPSVRGARFSVCLGIHCDGPDQPSTVIEARRLAGLAHAGEGLLSTAAAARMNASTRQFARAEAIERAGLEAGLVSIARQAAPGTFSQFARNTPRLCVRHQGRTLYVDTKHPRLLLGREPNNDLVLDDPRASRHHARIDLREGGFAFVDHSSNGSWVAIPGQGETFIKGREAALPAQGRIGLGFPADEGDAHLVDFDIR